MVMSGTLQRAAAYISMALCAVGAALYLGKDANWDMLNYHVYAGYSALENRLPLDYFAASTQGFFNPYSHVPLYLMISKGVSPPVIVAVLALFHALNLFIVYETASLLNRRADGKLVWLALGLAVLFAFLNPLFLLELGNTFNEISTAVLVLAGWYLLVRDFDRLAHRHVALAGLLIGAAVALKLTNMVFSVTALPLLLMAPVSWKRRGVALAVFAVAGLAGALLAGGWWAWQLWELFGSPFFPLFNNIFHAPGFSEGFHAHQRFVPQSVAAFLSKPFAIALPVGRIHSETAAPDLRYALLVGLLALFGLKYLMGRLSRNGWPRRDPFPTLPGQRALAALTIGFLLSWLFWLATSGNGRYFIAMAALGAVVLASWIVRFSANWRFTVYGGLSMIAIQGAMVLSSSDLRWAPVHWGDAWLDLDIPAPLQSEPSLYLHMGSQSASFLMPWLPAGASMINATGTWIVEDAPAMRSLLERYKGRTRVMRRLGGEELPPADAMGYGLERFGLEADMRSCEIIGLHFQSKTALGALTVHYAACKVRPLSWSAARMDQYQASKRRADAIFDRIEALCPVHFQPSGVQSERDGSGFWRNYSSTDIVLRSNEAGVIWFFNHFTRSQPRKIGRIDQLERELPPREVFCRPLEPVT